MSGAEKTIIKALRRQTQKHVPFWFMRQAGRYLPEYREMRAKFGGFMQMALTPEAAAEVTIQPLRRFGMDAAIIFSDILMLPYGLGQSVKFLEGEGPKLEPVESLLDLREFSPEEFNKRLSPVYEALRLTRSRMDSEGFRETALIGFAGAPWTVATYMVEGGSSREFIKTKTWAFRDPESFSKLINLIEQATIVYLREQIQAGAEVIQIFDSWAGALDAHNFRLWCLEPAKRIVAALKHEFPDIPVIGFPKGAGWHVRPYALETGIDGISVDWQISPELAAQELQPHLCVQGNLDPFALLAGGDHLKTAAEGIIGALSGGPFIFNLGHGINKDTPLSHVETLVRTIRHANP